jgi:hypothetical protein
LAQRGNAKKDGTVEAESSMKVRQAGNCRVRLDPADCRGTVQAGVVVFIEAAGAKSEEEGKRNAKEEQPTRALPNGAPTREQ